MSLLYWTADALVTYGPNALCPEQPTLTAAVETAKNEYESVQILLRADASLIISEVRVEGLDGFGIDSHYQRCDIYADGKAYPDALTNDKRCAVPANHTQSVWLNIYAPVDALSQKGTVYIETDIERVEVPVSVTVYDVTLPSPSNGAFSTEYWMTLAGCWWRTPAEEQQRDYIAAQYGCARFSERWWDIAESFAVLMRRNRINVLYVRTQDLLAAGETGRDQDMHWRFDWSVFDRFVSLLINKAEIKLLAGFHIIQQTEGNYVHTVDMDESGVRKIVDRALGSPEAEQWLDQFLPALWAHLKERGWDAIWIQHIEDEPASAEPWRYGRAFVRRHMPGVRCLDAIDNNAPSIGLGGEMDLLVPRIDIYEENRTFYDHRLALGDARWTYTCCVPNTPNYMNKFIDRPLIQNRLLGWGCFARGFTGFLHWGFNYWDTDDIYFGMRPDAMFKGDGYIVYPDPEHNGLLESVRMVATRDAAEDYELLKMLADRDPDKAYDIARSIVRSFRDFEWDVKLLRQARSRLLKALDDAGRSP